MLILISELKMPVKKDTLEILIQNNETDVNISDDNGGTALHYAVNHNQIDLYISDCKTYLSAQSAWSEFK